MLKLKTSGLTSVLLLLWGTLAATTVTYEFEVTVLDEFSQPMIGVNVFTDDESFATSTDLDGKATLFNLPYNAEVNFTYLGYRSLRVPFYELRKRGGLVRMNPNEELIEEFVVVGRRDEPEETIPYQVKRVDERDIQFFAPMTSADVLNVNGDVFIQKSQAGGGSPVLRGFEANRVLLVVDGVRMNNAIYRNGHLQNSITVDPAILERAEIIFGPGSLTYGSDALGGVVHYRTKDPDLFSGDAIDGRDFNQRSAGYVRFGTAAAEKRIHANVNFGRRRWGSFTSFSFVDFGHLMAGKNRPVGYEQFGRREFFAFRDRVDQEIALTTDHQSKQWGTEYAQMDFLQKLKFQPSDYFYSVLNFQFSTSSDVPRYDNLTERSGGAPKFAEWYYGPQRRLLISNKFRLLKPNALFDRATIIPAYQKVDEDRIRRKWQRVEREKSLVDVHVFSFTADLEKDLVDGHTLSYGVEGNHNRVDSRAFIEFTNNSVAISRNLLARYPVGGNHTTAYAGYVNHRWQNADSTLTTNAGLRYTRNLLFSRFEAGRPIAWPDNFLDGLRLDNDALTWAVGGTYNPQGGWQLRLLAATAFRSPNIDDWVKIREKSGNVTIPNENLRPERSTTVEATVGKTFGASRLSVTAFGTRLRDAMVRETFSLPGQPGVTQLIAPPNDTLRTLANVNAANGRVYGLSVNGRLQLTPDLHLRGSVNWTRGDRSLTKTFDDEDPVMRVDTLVPLDHIPPLYGMVELGWQLERLRLAAQMRFNGAKPIEQYAVTDAYLDANGNLFLDRDGTSDNLDLSYFTVDEEGSETIVGTLAWRVFNVYASYELSDRFALDLGVENLLDLHYRPFASGVSAPGRNFVLTLRGSF